MFKNTDQGKHLSILYSVDQRPLSLWDKKRGIGQIKKVQDKEVQAAVMELTAEGTNVITTYITCPADPRKTLGVTHPYLVVVMKNLKEDFTFEVQVLDDKNVPRRFRASSYHCKVQLKPFTCTFPMRLTDDWNQIVVNLQDFTERAYGTNYAETLRVQIHANCHLWRVYFSDRIYPEDELPAEFRLFLSEQFKADVASQIPEDSEEVADVTSVSN